MSASNSANGPSIQSLHNPRQAAHPQAPLGNATNGASLGAKALLAKKMAKNANPSFVSPTDNMMTPCSQKISAAKKKHFAKGPKPMPQLFAHKEASESTPKSTIVDDDENPF